MRITVRYSILTDNTAIMIVGYSLDIFDLGMFLDISRERLGMLNSVHRRSWLFLSWGGLEVFKISKLATDFHLGFFLNGAKTSHVI